MSVNCPAAVVTHHHLVPTVQCRAHKPNQTKPNVTKQNKIEQNQTKPVQTKPLLRYFIVQFSTRK